MLSIVVVNRNWFGISIVLAWVPATLAVLQKPLGDFCRLHVPCLTDFLVPSSSSLPVGSWLLWRDSVVRIGWRTARTAPNTCTSTCHLLPKIGTSFSAFILASRLNRFILHNFLLTKLVDYEHARSSSAGDTKHVKHARERGVPGKKKKGSSSRSKQNRYNHVNTPVMWFPTSCH